MLRRLLVAVTLLFAVATPVALDVGDRHAGRGLRNAAGATDTVAAQRPAAADHVRGRAVRGPRGAGRGACGCLGAGRGAVAVRPGGRVRLLAGRPGGGVGGGVAGFLRAFSSGGRCRGRRGPGGPERGVPRERRRRGVRPGPGCGNGFRDSLSRRAAFFDPERPRPRGGGPGVEGVHDRAGRGGAVRAPTRAGKPGWPRTTWGQ